MSSRTNVFALILCLLAGLVGLHRFYLGKWFTGILMFITFGGFGIWWIVDIYSILFKKLTDGDGNSLNWFGNSSAKNDDGAAELMGEKNTIFFTPEVIAQITQLEKLEYACFHISKTEYVQFRPEGQSGFLIEVCTSNKYEVLYDFEYSRREDSPIKNMGRLIDSKEELEHHIVYLFSGLGIKENVEIGVEIESPHWQGQTFFDEHSSSGDTNGPSEKHSTSKPSFEIELYLRGGGGEFQYYRLDKEDAEELKSAYDEDPEEFMYSYLGGSETFGEAIFDGAYGINPNDMEIRNEENGDQIDVENVSQNLVKTISDNGLEQHSVLDYVYVTEAKVFGTALRCP